MAFVRVREWYMVRAGSVIRSADGERWTVIRRTLAGAFTVARPGVPPVAATPDLRASVAVIQEADTSAEVAAAQAFVDAGFTIEILDEIAQLGRVNT